MTRSTGMATRKRSAKTKPTQARRPVKRARKPFVIDIHAHINNPPEVLEFTRGRTIDSSIPAGTPEKLAALDRKWVEGFTRKQGTLEARLKEMDRTGVDIQVLTTGILRSCTYWAAPEDGLRMDQLINEHTA